MIPNDKSLNGAIVLERGTHFISKQVILHMKLYAKMTKRKPLPYSHSEFLLWKDGQLYTIGSREDGTECSKVQDYYKDHAVLILFPKKPLTDKETEDAWRFYYHVDPSKYQYGNFLAWITYLKTGWFWSKKGPRRNYCYELTARFVETIGRWPAGKSTDMVSIYDLYENQNYGT